MSRPHRHPAARLDASPPRSIAGRCRSCPLQELLSKQSVALVIRSRHVLSNATLALYRLTLQHLRNSLGNLHAAVLGALSPASSCRRQRAAFCSSRVRVAPRSWCCFESRLSTSVAHIRGLRLAHKRVLTAVQANDIARCDVTSGATSRQVDVTSVIGGEIGSHTPATSLSSSQ